MGVGKLMSQQAVRTGRGPCRGLEEVWVGHPNPAGGGRLWGGSDAVPSSGNWHQGWPGRHMGQAQVWQGLLATSIGSPSC